jgi:putative FmdB family regulatory protein
MPHYEYLCTACNERFETVQTIDQHEQQKIACPKCGSTKVEQTFSAFYAVTSRKSAA